MKRRKWPISIHALREEGDPPLPNVRLAALLISIHALREEGDSNAQFSGTVTVYFYPRPPRGGRRHSGRKMDVPV